MSRVLILLFLVTGICHDVSAQDTRAVLDQAQRYNWIVRAVSVDTDTAEGRVRSVWSDSAMIGRTRIPVSSIAELDRQIRVGGSGKSAALTGAAVFGLVGWLLIRGFCEAECSVSNQAGGFAIGATVGGTAGGLIGGISNPSTTQWKRIWPK